MIVGVIELDSSFSRIESVTGLALNEVGFITSYSKDDTVFQLQWNALTDSSDSLSILHLSCLSTFIVGSPQAPDLAVFCSYPGIGQYSSKLPLISTVRIIILQIVALYPLVPLCFSVGDEGLRSVRSPELNQLCCNQLDCDSAVGCAALLFIPRYRGTIEKSQVSL